MGIKIKIDVLPKDKHDSYSDGIGICIVAETSTGCLFGGSGLSGPPKGRRNKYGNKNVDDEKAKYEEVGRNAARDLIADWNSTKNGCTDRRLQDQLIIFMALAKGKSRMTTCAEELHTKTAIHIAELMTGAKFNVSNMKDGTLLIECEGIGYSAKQMNNSKLMKAKKKTKVEQKDNDVDEYQVDVHS